MSIYDRAKDLAARLLSPSDKGAALTLHVKTAGAYDPDTGTIGETVTNHSGSGIRTNYAAAEVDGSLIMQDDVKLIVSPVQINEADMPQPKPADAITFAGSVYQVISVKPWNYAGVACGFEVQARK